MDRSEAPSSSSTLLPLEDAPSIGYLCPLYTELAAVIASFDEYLGQQEVGEDEYHYGRIGNRKAVGVNFDYGEMGPITAAEYASRLVLAHPSLRNPRSICLLVGIAGGLWTEERDVRLGDVVIGTRIWDWRAGKQTSQGLETTSFPKDVSKRLRRRLPSFLYDRDALERSVARQVHIMREKDRKNDLKWTYQGHSNDRLFLDSHLSKPGIPDSTQDGSNVVTRLVRTAEHPKIHDGLIASGNVVLKDAVNRKSLLEKRVYAVEMEACGVPNDFIVVRGISDYADSHKNDIWQPYAASVAAACARLLVDHFAASSDQDLMNMHRLNSDPSNVSWPQTSRTLSSSSVATNDKDDRFTQEPLPLRSTQSDLTLSSPTKVDGVETAVQQSRRPPPLPMRSGSKPTDQVQSLSKAPILLEVSDKTFATKDRDVELNSSHYTATQYGKALYSGTWKRATRKLSDHKNASPVSLGEKSWEAPRLTVYLLKAEPAYTSQCFLVFSSSGSGDGGLHDRMWLPLNGLKFGFVEGQMQIMYQTCLDKDEPLLSPTWLASGDVVKMQLLLEPQDANGSDPSALVDQLLVATKTLLPDIVTSNPASKYNAELAYGTVQVDADDKKSVLYIHQVDDRDMHYCALVAFGPKLNFRSNALTDHNQLLLKEMYSLVYDIVKPFALGIKSDETPPAAKVDWIGMRQTYLINRPSKTGRELLDNTIGKVAGWKALNVTRGITVTQMTDRGAMPFGGSILGRTVAKVFTKFVNQWDTYLFVWQKDDSIRFLLSSNLRLESDDKAADSQFDSWTIKAGRGELSKQKSSAGKWKVAFQLETRSREGDYISLTPDAWFDLPESYRISCADFIVLSFPSGPVFEAFQSSIDERFWKK